MEHSNTSSPQEDFRMRYKIYIDDIKYAKSRQWTVTYYLLLLFVAVVGLAELLKFEILEVSIIVNILLSVSALIVGFLGRFFLDKLHNDIVRYRKNLIEIIKGNHLTEEFKKYEYESHKREFAKDGAQDNYDNIENDIISNYTSPKYKDFTKIFKIIIWVAASFVVVYLWLSFVNPLLEEQRSHISYSPIPYMGVITLSGLCYLIGTFFLANSIVFSPDLKTVKYKKGYTTTSAKDTRRMRIGLILNGTGYCLLLISLFTPH